jgi:hypothetical protein
MRASASLSAILITLAACATANGPVPSGTETVRVSGAGGAMTAEIHPSDALRGGDVAVPLDRAWAVMRAVYDSLHLPVAAFDPSSRTIESPMLRVRRRLGDTPLSKYLNCGDTQGGQSADSYEIQLLVRTTLHTHQDTTSILTNVSAEGRPITLSGDYTRCISTGNLENRVLVLTTLLAVR